MKSVTALLCLLCIVGPTFSIPIADPAPDIAGRGPVEKRYLFIRGCNDEVDKRDSGYLLEAIEKRGSRFSNIVKKNATPDPQDSNRYQGITKRTANPNSAAEPDANRPQGISKRKAGPDNRYGAVTKRQNRYSGVTKRNRFQNITKKGAEPEAEPEG